MGAALGYDQWKKSVYNDLKTAYGDDYTTTEEQFNKLISTDEKFISDTYNDLKTAFGDDYTLTEEEFKKKVPTEVGTQDSAAGGTPEISSLGSADSLLRSSDSAVEKPEIPALEMPDTSAVRDETTVAPKEDRIAQGYTPEQVENQNNAFDIAYQAVKDHAIKPRKDAPKLVSERDEAEELDRDLVDVAVEAAGKKFKLSAFEKTNLRNRIVQTYQGEPSGEKARIAAGMEFKEKYGATPAEFNKFTFEKKAQGINAAAETEVNNINGAAKTAVTELDNSTVTANEELLKKYQAIQQSGEVPPEQVQAAFQKEQSQLIRAHANQRQNIQSRYLKEFNDATQKAESALQELYMDDTGSMTEEQKKVYAESYNKNFAAAEKIRNKGMQQMLRNKPIPEQIEIAFAAGVGDLYSSIGGALGMAGLEDANFKITRAVERQAAKMGSDVALEAESLGDASWWIANGVRTAPMMLALAPVGMVGGGVVATGARLAGASTRYTALAGSVGGGLVSWKAETMMEQALGFQQAIADGKTPEQAADIAVNIGKLNLANLPLQMMEIAPFFHKMPLAVGATVGVLSGSGEEVLQGWATNKAFAISENREYTFQDYVKDPEFGVTAVLGGAMSAPFVIGGAVKNAQDKRNFIGGTVRNLVHAGSYAKASGVVQAAFDNGTIDEKTLADFNIAIQAAANAAPQVVSIEDPHTSAAVEQNLVDVQVLQQQAASTPPGPVQDALKQQAEQKALEVQGIVTDTAPLFTIQSATDSAPRVMTESMMNDFLDNPKMIQGIADGEINVTIRNNPDLEKRVQEAVEAQKKIDENLEAPENIAQMREGAPITFQDEDGTLVKDKTTGENIMVTPEGKEVIISGGGDVRPLKETGVQSRLAKRISFEGKDYSVIKENGVPKVFVRSDKGKLIPTPLGKAKQLEILTIAVGEEAAIKAMEPKKPKAEPAAAPEPVSPEPATVETPAETPAEPVSSEGAEVTPKKEQFNEGLKYLLDEPSAVAQIGEETGEKKADGVSVFKTSTGSYRYVKYEGGKPVSALQVMSKDGKSGAIANVYTDPAERRKGHASELLTAARKDFETIDHSEIEKSGSGEAFAKADEKNVEPLKPETDGKETPQTPEVLTPEPQAPAEAEAVTPVEPDEKAKREEGKKETAKFKHDLEVPITFAIMEADVLQPSHLPSGERNPEHTIASAQPKERNDKLSKAAQEDIATKPKFKEVSVSPNAYFGAPVVNERGEVIQGNNRSIGLKKHYKRGGKIYKEELAKNAEHYGLTAEQVNAMKNPILVRIASVDDAMAVQLGQYTVNDLETGGEQRIDPLITSRKLSNADKSKIAALVFSDQEGTLNESIRDHAKELGTILKKHINAAQFNTAFSKQTGELTKSGIEDLQATIMHFLFEGGSIQLPEIFKQISATAKRGLEKSMKHIFAVSEENSLLPDLQNAILALADFMNTGEGDFKVWANQIDMFIGAPPKEVFSPLELKLAEELLNAKTQSAIPAIFQQYAESVNGKPGDMFTPEGTPGISKKEAIKQQFNIEIDESVQKPSAKKVDVRQSPGNGEGVGAGNAEKQNTPKKGKKSNEAIAQPEAPPELTPEEKAKNLISEGIEGILNKLGGVKNLTEQERTSVLQDLKKILEGALKIGGITLKNAIDDVIEHLRYKGMGKLSQDDITFFRRSLEGKEQIPTEEKPKETRKQAATYRAYMGGNGEQIRKELEDLGLEYDQMSNEGSEFYAEEIMRRFGREIGLQAIRDRVIEDQPAIHLYGKIIDAIDVEIAREKDLSKKAELIRHQARLVKEVGDYLTAGGQRSQAAREMYKNSNFGYLPGTLRTRARDANKGESVSSEEMAGVIAKLDQLAAQLAEVNEQLKAKEDERAAAAGELAYERIKNEALEAEKKTSWSDRAKKQAAKLDKAKIHRPGFFSAATPLSILWDGAIEATKLSLITTGKAADAVIAGIEYIRNSDIYKKLTASDQERAEDEFNKYFRDNPLEDAKEDDETITIDSKTKRLDIPFPLLKRLIKEGAKNIEELTSKVHEMIKDEFPGISHRDVRDAISKYGITSEPSPDSIRKKLAQMKRDGQLISAYEDVLAGKRPEKSGHQKSKPGQWQRETLRKIKDLLKNFPQDQAALNKKYAAAQDRIASALKNRIEDLNKQIANEEREKRNTKVVEYSDENKRLKQQVKDLEDQLTDLVGPKTLSHEDRVDRAVNRMQKSIEELDETIAAHELGYKTKPEKLSDPIIEALKAVKKAKQEMLKEMREAAGVAEAYRVKLYKDRLKQQIAKLEKKLADKDFTKPTKKEIQLDEETKKLEVEKLRLKDEMEEELEKIRLKNRTRREVIGEAVLEGAGLLRAASTTADLSAIGRQGFPLAVRNPRMAVRAFRNSIDFMMDENKAKAFERAVRSSPYYYDMKKAGLELTFATSKLNAKEEFGMTNLLNKLQIPIPFTGKKFNPLAPIAASNRAYVGFLNKLRVDVFLDAMELVDKAGLTGAEREEELKGFAEMTNVLTGRGSLGKWGNKHLPALNAIFFASKFLISRFKMLGYGITEALPDKYNPLPGAAGRWNRLPERASSEFRKTMLANLGFYAGLYTIARLFGADVEDDPRSSDFGKIKSGDTRFDQLVGLQQPIVLAARLATMATKNSTTGEIRPLNTGSFKDKTALDVVTDFLENKFAPVPTIGLEALRGKFRYDKKWMGMTMAEKGDEFSLGPAVANYLSPMWFSDIPEIYRDRGAFPAIGAGTASFFGSGVQNYSASIMDKAQREISDALQKKLSETTKDEKLKGFDIDKELVEIREKYKNDPEFNSREFNKRIGDVFTLQGMKGKPSWYRDVFYAGSNEDKIEEIQKESPTTEDLHKNVDELVEAGVISEKVKYEALGDKQVADLTSRLADQEFNNLREKYRMEMLYDKMIASKLLVADLTKGEKDIKKLVQKHKKEAMGFAAELAMQLGVENGARAQYVFDTMNDLKLSPKEKNEWLTSMALNKVISDQVAEQWAVLELQKALKEQEKQDQVNPVDVIKTTLQDTIKDVEVPQTDVEN